jgi:hypothetical protein
MVVSLLTSPEIGIKIDIYLTGKNEDKNISELGLFLNDNTVGPPATPATMFSRLVFEPIPLTAEHTYEITYYIYF